MGDEHFTQPRELRDEMAMAALLPAYSEIAANNTPGGINSSAIAEEAYRIADAMMEARKRDR